MTERHLHWDGCFNVRDLGGMRTLDGRSLRWGALVRADAVHRLTAAGWRAAVEHGVRTVIDLRNDDERGADVAPRPPEITTLSLPLDGIEDRAFWDEWSSGWQFGTPRYYGPHLAHFPTRHAALVRAFAQAAPGGVVIHCGLGRDRTGLATTLLLGLVGVDAATIAQDHALSTDRLPALFAALGQEDQSPHIARHLAEHGTSAHEVMNDLLAALDVEAYLTVAGVTPDELARARRRMLE